MRRSDAPDLCNHNNRHRNHNHSNSCALRELPICAGNVSAKSFFIIRAKICIIHCTIKSNIQPVHIWPMQISREIPAHFGMSQCAHKIDSGLAQNGDKLIEIKLRWEEETYLYSMKSDDPGISIAWWFESPIIVIMEIGPTIKEIS